MVGRRDMGMGVVTPFLYQLLPLSQYMDIRGMREGDLRSVVDDGEHDADI